LQGGGIPATNGDAGSERCKAQGDRSPDAAIASRDERDGGRKGSICGFTGWGHAKIPNVELR
jgi:hypothetical protein